MNRIRSIRAIALPLVLWCIAFLAGLVILAGGVVRGWIENESLAEKKFVARQMALDEARLARAAVAGNDKLEEGNAVSS